jgi:galactokinase
MPRQGINRRQRNHPRFDHQPPHRATQRAAHRAPNRARLPVPPPPSQLLHLEPVPKLIERARNELSADFDFSKPMRVSRAPGRLDVMGGIADYTGSTVCELPLDRAAAVLMQERRDRQIQAFSFNLFDEHRPFTFRIPLGSLANQTIDKLRSDLSQPGRRWAGYLVGCLSILNEQKLIDLRDESLRGMNLALLSTVPLGAGVSSSAAIEVATMMNLIEHFGLRDQVDPMRIAAMCQQVENRVVGAPCGIMDQATSCAGKSGTLLRMACQPHELQEPLVLPQGVRVIGINSNVRHSVGGGQYGITRCAAFMAHAMILSKMREMGLAAGRELARDPMNGYLANLSIEDYKRYFRSYLPEFMSGREFLDRFEKTIDTATTVRPDIDYPVQHAAEHHVLEAHRVKNFCEQVEAARQFGRDTKEGGLSLDKAGHLMYASHLSYSNEAMQGAPECDMLVELVRKEEPAGLYGAKITGGGSGGTVAILCNEGSRVDEAVGRIMVQYREKSGKVPELFSGSSPGAWEAGSVIVTSDNKE